MNKNPIVGLALALGVILFGCVGANPTVEILPRENSIPSNAVKVLPHADPYPPKLHSDEWEEPIPLPYPVNTAGAEDSPFITSDGSTLYFFFTPDPKVPVEQQLLDGVTGIYASQNINGVWGNAERIILQDPDKLSLDGCQFIQADVIWFCSAREGYTGIHWFNAEFEDGKWTNWQSADFNPAYEVGELHFSADWSELYFHSTRPGGQGGYDIWLSRQVDGDWAEPENIIRINSPENDGWPYLSQDGSELWFLRTYMGSPGLFRSVRVDDQWGAPELIVSQFAGEPSLDLAGNLYFVHHFYEDGLMIESDIYYAKRK